MRCVGCSTLSHNALKICDLLTRLCRLHGVLPAEGRGAVLVQLVLTLVACALCTYTHTLQYDIARVNIDCVCLLSSYPPLSLVVC
jgi:hypothetical protein